MKKDKLKGMPPTTSKKGMPPTTSKKVFSTLPTPPPPPKKK